MSSTPSREAVVRLRATLGREREALARTVDRVAVAVQRSAATDATFIEHSALGKALDDVYQAAERVFRSVARVF